VYLIEIATDSEINRPVNLVEIGHFLQLGVRTAANLTGNRVHRCLVTVNG
jgi:hypothetical protein